MVAELPATPKFWEISIERAREELLASGFTSCVGHPDTAALFTEVIGIQVPFARITVALKSGDTAIIGQYRGPRLPEGCHILPEGATIQWIKLEV